MCLDLGSKPVDDQRVQKENMKTVGYLVAEKVAA